MLQPAIATAASRVCAHAAQPLRANFTSSIVHFSRHRHPFTAHLRHGHTGDGRRPPCRKRERVREACGRHVSCQSTDCDRAPPLLTNQMRSGGFTRTKGELRSLATPRGAMWCSLRQAAKLHPRSTATTARVGNSRSTPEDSVAGRSPGGHAHSSGKPSVPPSWLVSPWQFITAAADPALAPAASIESARQSAAHNVGKKSDTARTEHDRLRASEHIRQLFQQSLLTR